MASNKTVMQYLNEREDIANNNIFAYASNYLMDTPKKGYEKEFAEAVRDAEIVAELIALVAGQETQNA